MERHGRHSKQPQTEPEKARLTSVDRLFFKDDIDRFVDVDLYEEDFYIPTEDISYMFSRPKRADKDNEALFQDPVFFSIYEFDKKKDAQPEDELKENEVDLYNDDMIDDLYDDYKKSGRKKKKKKKRSKYEKQKIGLTISLIITLLLIVGLAIGFVMAYKYSDSKKYVLKRDNTPPTATVTDHTIYNYERLEPEDFVSDIKDDTAVKISFAEPINYDQEGEQTVKIKLVDEVGNTSILEAKLTIIHDTTTPSIVCDPLIRVTVGQSVAYKDFVVVHDDYDDDPEITVDNSQVDLSHEGKYPLSYTATDKSGNSNTVYCEIEVNPASGYVDDQEVWNLVDSVLSWIITDDMDDLHKVWAVYEYVRNIPYALTDYSFNYMYEGYKILNDYRGDCYGSFAASKLMLDRLGIANIPIETTSNGHHYWNMVSVDGGKTWYHFDATQWTQWGYRPVMCMISSNDLYQISELHFGTHRYDAALYPETPAESMPIPDDIEEIYGYDY